MEVKQAEKLFYSGTANFSGDFIVKIYLDYKEDSDIMTNSALLICENNIDDTNHIDINKFDIILISSEVADRINSSNFKGDILKNKLVKSKEDISFLNEGDIIELSAHEIDKVRIFILYRIKSNNNFILTTNHCNNKCIMCPQPVIITKDDDVDLLRTEKIISMMDKQTKFLTITGGEPTLLKDKLVYILSLCKKYIPSVKIALLSNGRMFAYKSFVDAINSVGLKSLEIGIPVHSYSAEVHDSITQIPNSFDQTIFGIKNLIKSNNVEIRIVIQKDNYLSLDKISDLIISEVPDVSRVSFMGMEMLGSAVKNTGKVWVPYKEIGNNLRIAILKLLTHNIKVCIYNIPLCKVDEELRPLCMKSISDYKVRYLPECELCKEKEKCSGIFFSSLNLIKQEGVKPIN